MYIPYTQSSHEPLTAPAATRRRGLWPVPDSHEEPAALELPTAAPARSRLRTPGTIVHLLLVADLMAGWGALTISTRMVDGGERTAWLFGMVALLLTCAGSGLYRNGDLAVSRGTLDELPKLAKVTAVAVVAFVAGIVAIEGVSHELPAAAVLVMWATLIVCVASARIGARKIGALTLPAERCIAVADRRRTGVGDARIKALTDAKLEVVATLNVDEVLRARSVEQLLQSHGAHRLVVVTEQPPVELREITRRARNAGVKVTVCSDLLQTIGHQTVSEQVGGSIMISAASAELTATQRRLKRALDVAGSLSMLLVLSPLMLIFAAAIRLTSNGPVLFWQVRIGRDGRGFKIAKFRTMVQEAEQLKAELRNQNEAEGLFKIAQDPRITRVGGILRRTSLDELPQLINVLKGDMSLVGPRPLVCDEDEQIGGWHRDRLRMNPGMTGPWQVMGSARIPLHEMVLLDHQYVSNWSLWSDVRILLQTVSFVVCRRGL